MSLVLLDKRPEFDIEDYLGDALDSWQDLSPGYVSLSGSAAISYTDRVTGEVWSAPGSTNRPTYDTVAPYNLSYDKDSTDYLRLDTLEGSPQKFYGENFTMVKAMSLAEVQTDSSVYIFGNNNLNSSIGSCILLDNRSSQGYDQRIVWQVGDGSAPYTVDTTNSQTPDRVWAGDEKFVLSIQHGATEAVLRVNHIIYRRQPLTTPNYSTGVPARVTTRATISTGYVEMKEYGEIVSTEEISRDRLVEMTNYMAKVAGVTKVTSGAALPLYLIKGQSNAQGRGDASASLIYPTNTSVPGVIVNRTEPTDLAYMVSGRTESADNFFSSGNYAINAKFGADMAVYHGSDVIIVKGAYGGTSLNSDWWPNGAPGQTLIDSLNVDKEIMNMLDRMGRNYYLAGMVWFQGESDGLGETPANAYEQNFREIIAYIRDFHNVPTLPFLAVKLDWPATYIATVNTALETVATADPYGAFVDSGTWTVNNPGVDFHASSPTLDTIAASCATEMQELVLA